MKSLRWLPVAMLLVWMPVDGSADDWPHWRGKQRNDSSQEASGWQGDRWLPDQPAWVADAGEGSSSPIVVGNRVFVLGWKGSEEVLSMLDLESGRVIDSAAYQAPRYGRHATGDQGLYSGPSSTAEFDPATRSVFTLGSDGDLIAWDVSKPKLQSRWQRNLYDDYKAPRRPKVGRSGLRDYGYTSSPLVTGNDVIVEVGAKAGTLIAFDSKIGQERWRSTANDPAGHNGGPVPMTVDGVPCVAIHHFNGLLVVRIDKGHQGETVATYPWKTDFGNNVATPAVQGNSVVLTSAYNQYRIERIDISIKGGARKVWSRDEASKVCSPAIHNGSVYWAWRNVTCLDFETGQVRWKGGRVGDPGSCIITSDDRLIVWSGSGDLRLVETADRSPEKYQQTAERKRIGKDDAWPHIVLAHRRLLCKDRTGQIVCFSLQ